MKAQTLAICMPGNKCDRKCPYCVSKMTWAPPKNYFDWGANLLLVRAFAVRANVMDVIITGKGEPMMDLDMVQNVAALFETFPVVLQTNGVKLSHDLSIVAKLNNIEVIAVSVDSAKQFDELGPLWEAINREGRISRATVLLTNEVVEFSFKHWVATAQMLGVRQLSFREVTIPTVCETVAEAEDTASWIRTHIYQGQVISWIDDYQSSLCDSPVVRRLPYGAVVRDVGGIAVAFFEYCIQDSNGEDDIRSLIYNQDGHLYTTWNSPASMIF